MRRNIFFAAAVSAALVGLSGFGGEAKAQSSQPFAQLSQLFEGLGRNVTQPSSKTRRYVRYETSKKPGSIVVETGERALYYVLPGGEAIRYSIGVGRQGFQWSGAHKVSRKAEWPTWTPPAEMRRRQPGLPITMAGGPNNPLGARALYIGSTLYRIHGTNDARSIGLAMSSGCIRMMNNDVIDLYERVKIGARVYVYH
ncbi:lipoprotein-anchoring transpeptidase ErfK/SrfK [Rhodoligotrophos appendicifer]|uniref:L,D-transpeptidase n=1 Tax=Rhodoligotrophos appendicifer TaxID=987056 RepID=UPI0011861324|nr:L,D-transpeptidase [Rhodoligotrophos appendicifer]